MERTRTRRGGLVGPAILIGAGVMLLLNNIGMLDWNIWLTLLRFWPVLLIAIGLDILIGRRSWVGSAVIALLLLGLLAVVVMGGIQPPAVAVGSLVDRTETVQVELNGAQRADVEIDFGSGQLMVGALPVDNGDLLRGTLDLSRNEQLHQSQSVTNGRARVSLLSDGDWSVGFDPSDDSNKRWELDLNREVPLDLTFDTGVGASALDLTQLNLTRLAVTGGVGEVTVKLPERGQFDVEVDGGIGQITIIIPESLAARITVDGGLGNVQTPDGYEQRDNVYTSPGFAAAEDRAEISVDGGIGQIVVRQATE